MAALNSEMGGEVASTDKTDSETGAKKEALIGLSDCLLTYMGLKSLFYYK